MRFVGDITITPEMWYDPPILGEGLGMGTIVGSVLNAGAKSRSWGEKEWERIFIESGPVLGLGFVILRSSLFVWLLVRSIRFGFQGNVLPFLLVSAAGVGILNGQWGQATSLGFAIFGGGLCLAALNENDLVSPRDCVSEEEQTKQKKV